MKKNIKVIFIFILAVSALTFTIVFLLNWKNDHSQQHLSQKKETGRVLNDDVHYKTVVNKDNPVYHKIDKYLEKNQFNGAIAIFHNGQLVMNKGYGYQDFDNFKKSSANSMYLIGSAQKFTTGLMLKKLESEGKININDPITKYLPWFKTKKPLTLKDFMLHQSGMKKFEPNAQIHDIDGAARAMHKQGIQPGMYRVHQYNDGNYIILARVIEAVTKTSFAKYFNQNFAQPYHLERTAFYNDAAFQPLMAEGYNKSKTLQHTKFLDQYYGAGNLYMSPKDMGQLVFDLQSDKILPKNVTDSLLYDVHTKDYPGFYRYGFYSYGKEHRINGNFFGQQMTSYFNNEYIVVMGNNYQSYDKMNEKMLHYVYVHMLHQPSPKEQKESIRQQKAS